MSSSFPTPSDVRSQRIASRVRKFVDALREAVHDANHEMSGDARIVHYWDWASLEFAVRGREELAHRLVDSGAIGETELVEALYSAGFLGGVAMLRPHRAEFLSALSIWRDQQSRASSTYARKGGYEFDSLRQLSSLLANQPRLSEETIHAALEILERVSYQDFVRVQAESGTWQARLGRLVSPHQPLLDLEPHGESLRDLSSHPMFEEFARRVERSAPQRASKLAVAMDAAALTSLAIMNERAPYLEEKIYPRFFSSSRTLQGLMTDPWVESKLKFPTGDGNVWRSAQYYKMRALFPALRLGVSPETVITGPSLGQLGAWATKLHDALTNAPSREVEELVDSTLIDYAGEGSLLDLVDDLEESRLTRVWLQYSPDDLPSAFRQTLEGLHQLQSDERATAAAERAIRQAAVRFDEEVQEVRTATRLIYAVETELRQYVQRTQRDRVSLKFDLVSPRWGVEYQDDSDDVIVGVGNGDKGYGALLRQFDVASLRAAPDESLRYAAILLGIEQFELAGDLLEMVGHENDSPRHRLMAHVARLGRRYAEQKPNELVVDAHVRGLMEEWSSLAAPERPVLANGYAYAALLAWQLSAYGGAQLGLTGPRDDLGIAAWSIEVVQGERDSMSELGRIHADNHVLFTNASIGRRVGQYSEMLKRLEDYVVAHPNFRFLDTIGFVLLQDAKAQIRDGVGGDSLTAQLASAKMHLRRAHDLFPNDQEIRRHLEDVDVVLAA